MDGTVRNGGKMITSEQVEKIMDQLRQTIDIIETCMMDIDDGNQRKEKE